MGAPIKHTDPSINEKNGKWKMEPQLTGRWSTNKANAHGRFIPIFAMKKQIEESGKNKSPRALELYFNTCD